jgi:hypothetical protein
VSKKIHVSCYCITDTDIILLEFLLSVLAKTTDNKWILSCDTQSDLVIIDTDEQTGIDMYQKVLIDKNPPICITYSSKEAPFNSQFHLNKPMRSSDFISLIKTLLEKYPEFGNETSNLIEFTDEESKVHEDIKNTPLEEQENTIFDIKRPSKKRLYNILTANKNNTPIKVTFQNINIFIDYKNNIYSCKNKLTDLTSFIKSDITLLEINNISDDEFMALKSTTESYPLRELIWYSALLGSDGELNEEITEKSLLHLNQWPNFKALEHSPIHITLAAFMARYTCTLRNISTQTNIPLDEIINFLNANLVMGHLDIDKEKHPTKIMNITKNTEKVKLFDKLRHKLLKTITS